MENFESNLKPVDKRFLDKILTMDQVKQFYPMIIPPKEMTFIECMDTKVALQAVKSSKDQLIHRQKMGKVSGEENKINESKHSLDKLFGIENNEKNEKLPGAMFQLFSSQSRSMFQGKRSTLGFSEETKRKFRLQREQLDNKKRLEEENARASNQSQIRVASGHVQNQRDQIDQRVQNINQVNQASGTIESHNDRDKGSQFKPYVDVIGQLDPSGQLTEEQKQILFQLKMQRQMQTIQSKEDVEREKLKSMSKFELENEYKKTLREMKAQFGQGYDESKRTLQLPIRSSILESKVVSDVKNMSMFQIFLRECMTDVGETIAKIDKINEICEQLLVQGKYHLYNDLPTKKWNMFEIYTAQIPPVMQSIGFPISMLMISTFYMQRQYIAKHGGIDMFEKIEDATQTKWCQDFFRSIQALNDKNLKSFPELNPVIVSLYSAYAGFVEQYGGLIIDSQLVLRRANLIFSTVFITQDFTTTGHPKLHLKEYQILLLLGRKNMGFYIGMMNMYFYVDSTKVQMTMRNQLTDTHLKFAKCWGLMTGDDTITYEQSKNVLYEYHLFNVSPRVIGIVDVDTSEFKQGMLQSLNLQSSLKYGVSIDRVTEISIMISQYRQDKLLPYDYLVRGPVMGQIVIPIEANVKGDLELFSLVSIKDPTSQGSNNLMGKSADIESIQLKAKQKLLNNITDQLHKGESLMLSQMVLDEWKLHSTYTQAQLILAQITQNQRMNAIRDECQDQIEKINQNHEFIGEQVESAYQLELKVAPTQGRLPQITGMESEMEFRKHYLTQLPDPDQQMDIAKRQRIQQVKTTRISINPFIDEYFKLTDGVCSLLIGKTLINKKVNSQEEIQQVTTDLVTNALSEEQNFVYHDGKNPKFLNYNHVDILEYKQWFHNNVKIFRCLDVVLYQSTGNHYMEQTIYQDILFNQKSLSQRLEKMRVLTQLSIRIDLLESTLQQDVQKYNISSGKSIKRDLKATIQATQLEIDALKDKHKVMLSQIQKQILKCDVQSLIEEAKMIKNGQQIVKNVVLTQQLGDVLYPGFVIDQHKDIMRANVVQCPLNMQSSSMRLMQVLQDWEDLRDKAMIDFIAHQEILVGCIDNYFQTRDPEQFFNQIDPMQNLDQDSFLYDLDYMHSVSEDESSQILEMLRTDTIENLLTQKSSDLGKRLEIIKRFSSDMQTQYILEPNEVTVESMFFQVYNDSQYNKPIGLDQLMRKTLFNMTKTDASNLYELLKFDVEMPREIFIGFLLLVDRVDQGSPSYKETPLSFYAWIIYGQSHLQQMIQQEMQVTYPSFGYSVDRLPFLQQVELEFSGFQGAQTIMNAYIRIDSYNSEGYTFPTEEECFKKRLATDSRPEYCVDQRMYLGCVFISEENSKHDVKDLKNIIQSTKKTVAPLLVNGQLRLVMLQIINGMEVIFIQGKQQRSVLKSLDTKQHIELKQDQHSMVFITQDYAAVVLKGTLYTCIDLNQINLEGPDTQKIMRGQSILGLMDTVEIKKRKYLKSLRVPFIIESSQHTEPQAGVLQMMSAYRDGCQIFNFGNNQWTCQKSQYNVRIRLNETTFGYRKYDIQDEENFQIVSTFSQQVDVRLRDLKNSIDLVVIPSNVLSMVHDIGQIYMVQMIRKRLSKGTFQKMQSLIDYAQDFGIDGLEDSPLSQWQNSEIGLVREVYGEHSNKLDDAMPLRDLLIEIIPYDDSLQTSWNIRRLIYCNHHTHIGQSVSKMIYHLDWTEQSLLKKIKIDYSQMSVLENMMEISQKIMGLQEQGDVGEIDIKDAIGRAKSFYFFKKSELKQRSEQWKIVDIYEEQEDDILLSLVTKFYQQVNIMQQNQHNKRKYMKQLLRNFIDSQIQKDALNHDLHRQSAIRMKMIHYKQNKDPFYDSSVDIVYQVIQNLSSLDFAEQQDDLEQRLFSSIYVGICYEIKSSMWMGNAMANYTKKSDAYRAEQIRPILLSYGEIQIDKSLTHFIDLDQLQILTNILYNRRLTNSEFVKDSIEEQFTMKTMYKLPSKKIEFIPFTKKIKKWHSVQTMHDLELIRQSYDIPNYDIDQSIIDSHLDFNQEQTKLISQHHSRSSKIREARNLVQGNSNYLVRQALELDFRSIEQPMMDVRKRDPFESSIQKERALYVGKIIKLADQNEVVRFIKIIEEQANLVEEEEKIHFSKRHQSPIAENQNQFVKEELLVRLREIFVGLISVMPNLSFDVEVLRTITKILQDCDLSFNSVSSLAFNYKIILSMIQIKQQNVDFLNQIDYKVLIREGVQQIHMAEFSQYDATYKEITQLIDISGHIISEDNILQSEEILKSFSDNMDKLIQSMSHHHTQERQNIINKVHQQIKMTLALQEANTYDQSKKQCIVRSALQRLFADDYIRQADSKEKMIFLIALSHTKQWDYYFLDVDLAIEKTFPNFKGEAKGSIEQIKKEEEEKNRLQHIDYSKSDHNGLSIGQSMFKDMEMRLQSYKNKKTINNKKNTEYIEKQSVYSAKSNSHKPKMKDQDGQDTKSKVLNDYDDRFKDFNGIEIPEIESIFGSDMSGNRDRLRGVEVLNEANIEVVNQNNHNIKKQLQLDSMVKRNFNKRIHYNENNDREVQEEILQLQEIDGKVKHQKRVARLMRLSQDDFYINFQVHSFISGDTKTNRAFYLQQMDNIQWSNYVLEQLYLGDSSLDPDYVKYCQQVYTMLYGRVDSIVKRTIIGSATADLRVIYTLDTNYGQPINPQWTEHYKRQQSYRQKQFNWDKIMMELLGTMLTNVKKDQMYVDTFNQRLLQQNRKLYWMLRQKHQSLKKVGIRHLLNKSDDQLDLKQCDLESVFFLQKILELQVVLSRESSAANGQYERYLQQRMFRQLVAQVPSYMPRSFKQYMANQDSQQMNLLNLMKIESKGIWFQGDFWQRVEAPISILEIQKFKAESRRVRGLLAQIMGLKEKLRNGPEEEKHCEDQKQDQSSSFKEDRIKDMGGHITSATKNEGNKQESEENQSQREAKSSLLEIFSKDELQSYTERIIFDVKTISNQVSTLFTKKKYVTVLQAAYYRKEKQMNMIADQLKGQLLQIAKKHSYLRKIAIFQDDAFSKIYVELMGKIRSKITDDMKKERQKAMKRDKSKVDEQLPKPIMSAIYADLNQIQIASVRLILLSIAYNIDFKETQSIVQRHNAIKKQDINSLINDIKNYVNLNRQMNIPGKGTNKIMSIIMNLEKKQYRKKGLANINDFGTEELELYNLIHENDVQNLMYEYKMGEFRQSLELNTKGSLLKIIKYFGYIWDQEVEKNIQSDFKFILKVYNSKQNKGWLTTRVLEETNILQQIKDLYKQL